MAVMIGTGPDKGSHTAVAVGAAGEPLGKLRVRACPDQAGKLVAWAQAWPERTWAVEGARGLGRMVARQLAPPASGWRCAAQAGCPGPAGEAGDTNKTDPNDARSVAVAALRSKGGQEVTADGHAVVLKVRAKRHRDLSRTRNQVVCRLHAVLCELIPGGVPDEITAGQAARILEQVAPASAVAQARCQLAAELLAGIGHLDAQRRQVNKKLAAAVTASGTSLTEVFGVGPVIATVIGDVITVARFPSRDHFAACNGTAPGRGGPLASGRFTGCRCAATGASTTPSIWPRSPRSGTSTATAAPTTSASSPRANPQAGAALPQTADQRRHLRAAARRCPQGGPGTATGE
jgi:transposase